MRYAAESSILSIEDALLSTAQAGSVARSRFEDNHAENNWFAISALDSMIGMTHAASLMLSNGGTVAVRVPPDPISYVVSALAVRALSVSHEISALLRAGFPVGARGRWRTLYEIDVVANVLAAGNRGTAARYVNHRWVQLARDREREADAESWPAKAGPAPDVMRRRLLRRYGSTFGGTYGWAAELARRKLKVKSPVFRDLEEIAQLGGQVSRVHLAHHGVHADSFGALLTIDDSLTFHSGASVDGVAEGCLDAIRALGETWAALLRHWNSYAKDRRVEALRSMNAELSLVLQRDCLTAVHQRPPSIAPTVGPHPTPPPPGPCTR
jgi:hypothetical protein